MIDSPSVAQDPIAGGRDLHFEFELVLSVTVAGSNALVFGSRCSLQCAHEIPDCAFLVPDESCCDKPRLDVLLLDVDLAGLPLGCSVCCPPHGLPRRHPESVTPREIEVRKLSPKHGLFVVIVEKVAAVDGVLGLGDCCEQCYEVRRTGGRPLHQCLHEESP